MRGYKVKTSRLASHCYQPHVGFQTRPVLPVYTPVVLVNLVEFSTVGLPVI